MADDFLVNALGNVAAPVIICLYTLFQVNKNLEKLANSFDRWGDLIDRRLKDLEDDVKALKNARSD